MRILYVARSPKPTYEHAPLGARRVELDQGDGIKVAKADTGTGAILDGTFSFVIEKVPS